MTTMLQGLHNETNVAYTENGAMAKATTNSNLLDMFAQGGALRVRPVSEIEALFDRALCEDQLIATKMAFYFRDVRGGQGERTTFRTMLNYLAKLSPETVRKNLANIPFYGRWDDLYCLVGTPLEAEAFALMKTQFDMDLQSEAPSLLGKWLKSENTSSADSTKLAVATYKAFGMTPKAYRKALVSLRKKIKIVESLMCDNKWSDINYSTLPSNAGFKYKKAFGKRDTIRYGKYLADVASGKEKINAGVLYPYEIVREILESYDTNRTALNVMWNNLPDYTEGSNENSICVVDTSGSMRGLPMAVAISLGIYCAERCTGPYKDHFITFSEKPKLQKVQGSDIVSKVQNLSRANWDMNTNVKAVFDLVLKVAVDNKLTQDEIVKKLYIISDMEFDSCATDNSVTLFTTIRKKFEAAGYEIPMLVFWNVNSRNKQFPMSMDERGFQMVSGCSPSIFKNLMKNSTVNAYELMLEVINSDRYSRVVI